MARHALKINPYPWNVTAIVMLAVAAIGYLAIVNSNATAGYEFGVFERQSDALREEVRRLEVASISARSQEQIVERITAEGFVPVTRMAYLTQSDRAVAKR
ncbi:MAG: hypothetical protein V1723_00580 [Candidatus Uhrbacteria bacterium]